VKTVFALFVAASVTACSLGDSRPGDRVQLSGSTWAVTQLNGQPPTDDLTLTFDSGVDKGDISASCFRLTFEFGRDTDGAAIVFSDLKPVKTTCGVDMTALLASLQAALPRIRAWRAANPEQIDFVDAEGVPLLAATQ
jgi:hypothetical protein